MFAHKRLREKPPSGGVSVLRESIPLAKELTDSALRLLQQFHWHGVAMVEFKEDQLVALAAAHGSERAILGVSPAGNRCRYRLPWLLLRMAKGQDVRVSENNYQCGVKSRWLLGDLDHLLMRLFKSDETLNLPPGHSTKWGCLIDFAQSFNHQTLNEIERMKDFGPLLLEWKRYMGKSDMSRPVSVPQVGELLRSYQTFLRFRGVYPL